MEKINFDNGKYNIFIPSPKGKNKKKQMELLSDSLKGIFGKDSDINFSEIDTTSKVYCELKEEKKKDIDLTSKNNSVDVVKNKPNIKPVFKRKRLSEPIGPINIG